MEFSEGVQFLDRGPIQKKVEELERVAGDAYKYLDDVEDLSQEELLGQAAQLQRAVNEFLQLVALKGDTNLPIGKVWLEGYRCRCGHEWSKRNKDREPKVCPKCKSPNWNEIRRYQRK